MLHYLVNTVTYSGPNGLPQKVLPGTGVDSSDVRFALLLAAGAVLFPGSYPTVAQAALRCSQARRVAADERQLEAIMQGALNAITAQGDAAGEPMTLTAGSPNVAVGRVLVPNAGDATVRLADATGLAMLALDAMPSGVALAAGSGGGVVPVASTGTLPSSVTGLGAGLARPVGLSSDGSGRLARSIDWTSCVPGFYLGDVDVDGEFTFNPRLTARVSSYTKMVHTQPTWEIDPTLGNDRNEGTLGKPLKTFQEQFARVGVHEVNGDMTSNTPLVAIYIRGSLPATDCMEIDLRVRGHSGLAANNARIPYQVFGTPTQVRSGTLLTVRAHDNTTGNGTPWGITTDVSLSSDLNVIGRFLQKTNQASFPPVYWLAKDEGAGLYRISYPTYFSTNDIINGGVSPVMAPGDTFAVYDLPYIPSSRITCTSDLSFSMLLNRLRFAFPSMDGGGFCVTECAYDIGTFTGVSNITNCQVGSLLSHGSTANSYFTYGIFLNSLKILQGEFTFQNYVMFQGGTWLVGDGNARVHCHTRGAQFYDSGNDGIRVSPGDEWFLAGGMIGTGNAAYGLNVMRGGEVNVGGLGATGGRFFRQTGTLGDMKIGEKTSGPAVATTNPYGYTADIPYTHDNFNTPVASGGFGQNIPCPTAPRTGIIYDGGA